MTSNHSQDFGTSGFCPWRGVTVFACLAWLVMLAASPNSLAAGFTVENSDRNKVIEIQDVLTERSTATILYSTRPQTDQAHRSERCALNLYLLELKQGALPAQPIRLANKYCASRIAKARLLTNGDVLLVSGDSVQTWRAGQGQVTSWSLGAAEKLKGRWNGAIESGAMLDADTSGRLVLAKNYPRKPGDRTRPSGLVTGFAADGQLRWHLEFGEPGVSLDLMDAWATADGGALLHLVAGSMGRGAAIPGVESPAGKLTLSQNRLYRVSASGSLSAPVVIGSFETIDFSNPAAIPDMSSDPEAMRAFLQGANEQTQGVPLAAGEVRARPGPGDVMDVMMGAGSRTARLLRMDKTGAVVMEADLTKLLEAEGLQRWVDFSSDSGQVWLFGSLGTRQNRLPQGYVSQIELPDGPVSTRLAPLSELGLSEARAAGDEAVQYLEHNPSQQPQRISRLGVYPVTISLTWRARRQAIQIDVIDDQSMVFKEARDERRADQAKEAQRAQRNANREASQKAMNSKMAAAMGVSEEAYAAMDKRERQEAMVRSGDMEAILAAAMQQVQAQQETSGTEMTPEMTAAIAQAQQAMAGAGLAAPAIPAGTGSGPSQAAATGSSAAEPAVAAENTVSLDANLHGTIEFEHPDGSATTLVVRDRQSGEALFRKHYPDGSVYEYLDFGRYQRPPSQFAVEISDAGNPKLRELTPVVVD